MVNGTSVGKEMYKDPSSPGPKGSFKTDPPLNSFTVLYLVGVLESIRFQVLVARDRERR